MATKKQVLRLKYDITSKDYDAIYAEEQLEKYTVSMKHVDVRNKVLDCGCGTALFIEFLKGMRRLYNVNYYLCLDLSPGMLKQAKRRIRKLSLGFLAELVEADAEHLPLRDKSVETAVSFTVINLLEDKTKGIRELQRVTRGCVLVSVLKLAEKLDMVSLRFGKYIDETSKDKIFLQCNNASTSPIA